MSGPAPILDAPADRPLFWLVGGVAVVALTLLLGFVFPSLPAQSDEVRSSNFALSETGADGRTAYLRAGCASCHTQVVRSLVADVGLGAATLADTNQVTGFRRIGPDLANVGTRLNPDEISAAITGSAHPALALSDDALGSVVAYLSEAAAAGGE